MGFLGTQLGRALCSKEQFMKKYSVWLPNPSCPYCIGIEDKNKSELHFSVRILIRHANIEKTLPSQQPHGLPYIDTETLIIVYTLLNVLTTQQSN